MPELHLTGGAFDGLAVHYVQAGRGPVVVLVHGLGGFAASWGPTMGALAGQATVLAPDLPGFGRSAKPRTRYGLDFLAAALDAFLGALDVRPMALVAHSLGAAVALAWTLARPGRVDRLALLGGLVPGFAYRLAPAYRLLALPGVGEGLALLGCAPLYRAALSRCFHRPRPADIAFLIGHDYALRTGWGARAAYLATLRAMREDFASEGPQYRRALAGLDLPILLIHGREDPVVPAGHCLEVARALPRVDVRWLAACGHFPQLEQARTVHQWLSEFLVARPAPR
jgi:pimeloyl-ACP methyl ester carboxylesterase